MMKSKSIKNKITFCSCSLPSCQFPEFNVTDQYILYSLLMALLHHNKILSLLHSLLILILYSRPTWGLSLMNSLKRNHSYSMIEIIIVVYIFLSRSLLFA
jgi:hypothetical protein